MEEDKKEFLQEGREEGIEDFLFVFFVMFKFGGINEYQRLDSYVQVLKVVVDFIFFKD